MKPYREEVLYTKILVKGNVYNCLQFFCKNTSVVYTFSQHPAQPVTFAIGLLKVPGFSSELSNEINRNRVEGGINNSSQLCDGTISVSMTV